MPDASENFPNVPAVPSVDHGNPTCPLTWEKFIGQAMADYESPLIGYASTILNDIDLARDVVQDTFIRLCQQDIAKVRHGLKSWLFTVCRNRALDILRKNKRIQPPEDIQWREIAGPDLQPDEQADRKEISSRLETYLDRLSPNQREVIILKFQQGLSYQEIREITGLKTGNVGFLIHTGLKRLRDILPDDVRL
jgi:RNA polymerase sigma-70 factor (ECF subfamily)